MERAGIGNLALNPRQASACERKKIAKQLLCLFHKKDPFLSRSIAFLAGIAIEVSPS
jgi:hypothetical protein